MTPFPWPRHFVVAIACVCVLVPAARSQEPAGLAKDKLDALSAMLQKGVADKKMGGGSVLIGQHGKIVYRANAGHQDIEAKVAIADNTIYRIASMSKPITSVAVMILVEDGKLATTDLLSKFVPEFKEMKVLVVGKDGKSSETVPVNREITIHDLLTHSSGITYRLMNKPVLGKMYEDAGINDGLTASTGRIGDNVKKLAKLPLVCQPGSAWEYGLNTDVLGHIVEVVSGKSLEDFCRERIFAPLKLDDTWFVLPKDKWSRLAAIYTVGADKNLAKVGDKPSTQPGALVFSANYPMNEGSKYFSGGGGLSSTADDYFRFSQMLLNRGELDGVRVLKAETVDRMTQNQLGDLRVAFPGGDLMGFGFGILSDKSKEASKDPAGVGTYGWGGAFGTYFWIDPKNKLIGVYMTQMFPPDFALGMEVKKLTYDAMAPAKK